MSLPNEIKLRSKSHGTSTGMGGLSKLKTILVHKHKPPIYSIIINNRDFTPRRITSDAYVGPRERQIKAYDMDSKGDSLSTVLTAGFTVSNTRFKSHLQQQTTAILMNPLTVSKNVDKSFDVLLKSESQSTHSRSQMDQSFASFGSSISMDETNDLKDRIKLILNETETFFIFEMPSCTIYKDSEQGVEAEKLNKIYEYLTSPKGRNRKVVDAETQTLPILTKTRATDAEIVEYQDKQVFASVWDMHDTFWETEMEERQKRMERQQKEDEDEDVSEADAVDHKLAEIGSIESYRSTFDEKVYAKLVKNRNFHLAACVIERILSNNCFNMQQKRFKGLLEPDLFRENVEFKYRLNLLWTFANDQTQGKSVTSFEWNPDNSDILAVSYGKFHATDNVKGLVLVWNIKNCVQPERQYDFDKPVTSISFSKINTDLLAVACNDGSVYVLSIKQRKLEVLSKSKPAYESIWQVSWQFLASQASLTEQIYACYDNGKVIAFTLNPTKALNGSQIMRTVTADGKLKGIEMMRKCQKVSVPITKYSGAIFVVVNPGKDSYYYLGTQEGVIHECSTYYLNQHLDSFAAHEGPVNALKMSPFTSKIFATCGSDARIRIWAEDMREPLLEMSVNLEPIFSIDWSPVHSTILASISGKDVYIWDLQRKFYEPLSVTRSPTNEICTVVEFVESGRCLVVGDCAGNVHVFSLEDMPFQPFFQENFLFEALKSSLVTKPEVISKLKKTRKKLRNQKRKSYASTIAF